MAQAPGWGRTIRTPGAGRNPPPPFSAPSPHPQSGVPVPGEFAGLRGRFPRSCPTGVSVASTPGSAGSGPAPRPRPRVPRVSPVRRRSVAAGAGRAQCAGAEWRRGRGGWPVRRRRGPGWCSRVAGPGCCGSSSWLSFAARRNRSASCSGRSQPCSLNNPDQLCGSFDFSLGFPSRHLKSLFFPKVITENAITTGQAVSPRLSYSLTPCSCLFLKRPGVPCSGQGCRSRSPVSSRSCQPGLPTVPGPSLSWPQCGRPSSISYCGCARDRRHWANGVSVRPLWTWSWENLGGS